MVTRVDLGALIRDGIPEPERICGGRLYLGQVHLLAGKPEAGKTTMALSWGLEVLRAGGRFAVLDEESGRTQMARRVLALGGTAEEADRIEYYEFPAKDLKYWEGLAEAMKEAKPSELPTLIMVDSAAKALVRAKLDENSNTDVTTLFDHLTMIARSPLLPALVVIDHMNRAEPDGQYSRGASAKLASADVMYRLDQVKAFSREEDGVVNLVVTKDREGCLRRHARLHVTVTPSIAFVQEDAPGEAGLSPAAAKVLEALDQMPRTISELTDRIVTKHGHGLRRETMSRELNRLADAGLARRYESTAGRPSLWSRPSMPPESPACDQSQVQSRDDHGRCDRVTDPPIGGHTSRSQVTGSSSGLAADDPVASLSPRLEDPESLAPEDPGPAQEDQEDPGEPAPGPPGLNPADPFAGLNDPPPVTPEGLRRMLNPKDES